MIGTCAVFCPESKSMKCVIEATGGGRIKDTTVDAWQQLSPFLFFHRAFLFSILFLFAFRFTRLSPSFSCLFLCPWRLRAVASEAVALVGERRKGEGEERGGEEE